jgi:FAD/FMN-containing dehydrogenase
VATAVERHSAIVRAALAPWEAERNYPNFAERSLGGSDFYSPETCERLRRVKAQYDPRNLIRSSHPIPTA